MEVPDGSLVEVRETPKGRGVFAKTALVAGTPVIVGKCLAESKLRTRYTLQMNYGLHVDLDEPGKLVNHSCDPNTYPESNEYGGYTFTARRPIAKDEEITFDYDMTEFFSIAVPECLCQTTLCRGKTRGFVNLPKEKRCEYGDQVGAYARRWLPVGQSNKVVDTSSPSRFVETAFHAVTDRFVDLFRMWSQAAASFPKDTRILDICPGPSLLPAIALSNSCVHFEIAEFEEGLLTESMEWKKSTARFDWSPFVLLALMSEGLLDPAPELLSKRTADLQKALRFSKLSIETLKKTSVIQKRALAERLPNEGAEDLKAGLFDVINISDAAYFLPNRSSEYESGELSVKEWIFHIQDLLKFLKPDGHLLVTLPPDPSENIHVRYPRSDSVIAPLECDRSKSSSRPRQLTAGTCLEALQAPELGLSIVFHDMSRLQDKLPDLRSPQTDHSRQTTAASQALPTIVLLSQKKKPR